MASVQGHFDLGGFILKPGDCPVLCFSIKPGPFYTVSLLPSSESGTHQRCLAKESEWRRFISPSDYVRLNLWLNQQPPTNDNVSGELLIVESDSGLFDAFSHHSPYHQLFSAIPLPPVSIIELQKVLKKEKRQAYKAKLREEYDRIALEWKSRCNDRLSLCSFVNCRSVFFSLLFL